MRPLSDFVAAGQVIRRMGCMLNADKEKVLKRDLATYINRCMESVDEKAKQ